MDADRDGVGGETAVTACAPPFDYVSSTGDCDDDRADVYPGATETCDGVDNDCDTAVDEAGATGSSTFYLDSDRDGSGNPTIAVTACSAPSGYVADNTDCCDADGSAHPGSTVWSELPSACGSFDYDCDGVETLRISTTGGCTYEAPLPTCAVFPEGWLGVIPECGESGSILETCELYSVFEDFSGPEDYCLPEIVTPAVQECR